MNTKSTLTSAPSAGTSSGLGAGLAGLKASMRRQGVTWQDTDPNQLMRLVAAIVEEGSLVSFSKTSDGGALVLTVLTNKVPERFYAANADELEALVTSISEVVHYTS